MPRILTPEKHDAALKAAIKAAGGPTKLAAALELVPSAITQWRRIPAERAKAISDLSGIPLHELRPDLWDAPTATAA